LVADWCRLEPGVGVAGPEGGPWDLEKWLVGLLPAVPEPGSKTGLGEC
jgi:hypothetical protein